MIRHKMDVHVKEREKANRRVFNRSKNNMKFMRHRKLKYNKWIVFKMVFV